MNKLIRITAIFSVLLAGLELLVGRWIIPICYMNMSKTMKMYLAPTMMRRAGTAIYAGYFVTTIPYLIGFILFFIYGLILVIKASNRKKFYLCEISGLVLLGVIDPIAKTIAPALSRIVFSLVLGRMAVGATYTAVFNMIYRSGSCLMMLNYIALALMVIAFTASICAKVLEPEDYYE